MEACRDCDHCGGDGSSGSSGLSFTFRLQHSPRHFLDEKRDAISAFDNVLPHRVGKCVVACYVANHRTDFTLPEPIKAEGGDIGSSKPRRFKLNPERDD
jgi:hypothetical protein